MRLFVIRHAEPEPFQGPDPPLTSLGEQQAARLAEAFAGERLDGIICSTMRRAMLTAAPLSQAVGAPLTVEPELIEIDLGEVGRWGPRERDQWAAIVERWRAGDFTAGARDGESLADVIERVEPAIERLVGDPALANLAIVAHAVVNSVILCALCPDLRGKLGQHLGLSHAGVWELEGQGRSFRVVRWNDTSHLAATPAPAPVPTCCACIVRDGRLLLIQRGQEPGEGEWSFPGGRIELGETIFEAVKREVTEEVGVEIEPVEVFQVYDWITRGEADRVRFHYVVNYVRARYVSGEPRASDDALQARWVGEADLDSLSMHPFARETALRLLHEPAP
jgi:ADP-ribose pyrophosphatase